MGTAVIGVMSSTAVAAAPHRSMSIDHVTVTAAKAGSPTVVLAHLFAHAQEVTITAAHLKSSDRSGFFLDVNLCDAGTTPLRLPNVVLAPHAHMRFSTKGFVAAIYRSGERLRPGMTVKVSLSVTVNGLASELSTPGIVVRSPVGLRIPADQ